jgi:5-methylcytosine-specific restriction endonuclease McrA
MHQKLNDQKPLEKRALQKLRNQRLKHLQQLLIPKTHKQCEAKFYLQTEHIVPFAKGGTSQLQNLQLLCPAHNRLRAIEQYGINKMQNYLPQLKS